MLTGIFPPHRIHLIASLLRSAPPAIIVGTETFCLSMEAAGTRHHPPAFLGMMGTADY
jgi:hypothetical protein